MNLILAGGQQRNSAVWLEEWHHYKKAMLLEINWKTNAARFLIDYITPRQYLASNTSNILFKASSLYDNVLYLCTQTEVLVYSFPSLALINNISYPCFNDLHHVALINGTIAVVSTGLDMVVFLNQNLDMIEYINVLNKPPWKTYSIDIDYRKIETTKPHESHPNFVFEIDGEPWATRFEQKDAVRLFDFSKRIDVGVERIHDGVIENDYVYFTTIDGMVCVAHKYTHKIEAVYDLNLAYDAVNPLGWCRGVCIENDRLFVGFSSLRSTKIRENLAWISRRFATSKEQMRAMPSRIVEYNMKSRSIVKEVNISEKGMDAVFSIHKIQDYEATVRAS